VKSQSGNVDVPGRLDGELIIDIPYGEPLAIDGANGYSPLLFGYPGELWNVGSTLEKVKY
jgi:hypothetical protein